MATCGSSPRAPMGETSTTRRTRTWTSWSSSTGSACPTRRARSCAASRARAALRPGRCGCALRDLDLLAGLRKELEQPDIPGALTPPARSRGILRNATEARAYGGSHEVRVACVDVWFGAGRARERPARAERDAG